MKKLLPILVCLLLLVACGQSYEETKRLTRLQRREAMRQDSAALKFAVLPTLDCLPLYVAQHYDLLDTLHGGVRLKMYNAQIDGDTALLRGRVEGLVTDLVRAKKMEQQGLKVRYWAVTNSYWQLLSNRQARIRKLRQLEDKMIAMTRFSATDLLSDLVADTTHLQSDHVFKVQVNDLTIRMQMLQNNEMDALWLTEPQATMVRLHKHPVLFDSRSAGLHLGVVVFNDQEMQRPERAQQLALFLKAYDQACDSINKHGVRYYRNLVIRHFKVRKEYADSLPQLTFPHAQGPSAHDMARVEQWLQHENNPKSN